MNSNEVLSLIFQEAQNPGIELEPVTLLAAIAKNGNAIPLFNHDQNYSFYQTLQDELGFIWHPHTQDYELTKEWIEKQASIIRWLIREFRTWKEINDTNYQKLAALFFTASYVSPDKNIFWSFFSTEVEQNCDLLKNIEKLLKSLHTAFGVRGSRPEPIWEREAVENFKQADSIQDWHVISELWRCFEGVCLPDSVLEHMTSYLYFFGKPHLINALNNVSNILTAKAFVESLTFSQRLEVGLLTNNSYIHFACAFTVLSFRRINNTFDDGTRKLLTDLLLKISTDHVCWIKWMQVFNKYPLRYPDIQVSLGHALAEASEDAIQAYIEAIDLSVHSNKSRSEVANCLRSFQERAILERRKYLWSLAYKRWLDWNFASKDSSHLFDVSYSELDYAVMGYCIECMDDSQRNEALNNIISDLNKIGITWQNSLIDCVTAWNRHLSRFQPYAHATQVISSTEDWLAIGKQYEPNIDPTGRDYLKMMYNTR